MLRSERLIWICLAVRIVKVHHFRSNIPDKNSSFKSEMLGMSSISSSAIALKLACDSFL